MDGNRLTGQLPFFLNSPPFFTFGARDNLFTCPLPAWCSPFPVGDSSCAPCVFCPNDPINDVDSDTICNDFDVCPDDPLNDIDSDGICGDVDNCPLIPNTNQDDSDQDGIGDVCDSSSTFTPTPTQTTTATPTQTATTTRSPSQSSSISATQSQTPLMLLQSSFSPTMIVNRPTQSNTPSVSPKPLSFSSPLTDPSSMSSILFFQFQTLQTRGSLSLRLSPSLDPETTPVFDEPSDSETSAIPVDLFRSGVVDINLSPASPKGSFRAEICLLYRNANGGPERTERTEDLCLGFFDVERGRWLCEDSFPRLNKTDNLETFVCGKTDHFTSFAVLLSGAGKGSSDGYDYFTGDWRGDVGVSAFVALVLLVVGAIIIAIAHIRKKRQPPPMPRRIRSGDLIPLSQQVQIR